MNQLFVVIKRKPFKFYYLWKYKIRRGHIWARSGPHFTGPDLAQSCEEFHYWSGDRQITLSGPHFTWSGPHWRPTKISARGCFYLFLNFWHFFVVVYKNRPRKFHMSLTTPLSRKSRAHGVNNFDLSDNLKQKKSQNYYLLSPWLLPDTHFFRNSKISQNCRFWKKIIFFSFFCANNDCKNLLDPGSPKKVFS